MVLSPSDQIASVKDQGSNRPRPQQLPTGSPLAPPPTTCWGLALPQEVWLYPTALCPRAPLHPPPSPEGALFTYEGNSNDLRVAGTGDGGLEELVEELSSGKVMYAFCRVKDPNSGLPKFVLINWTGEGVNDVRKGACANHVSTIANFLKVQACFSRLSLSPPRCSSSAALFFLLGKGRPERGTTDPGYILSQLRASLGHFQGSVYQKTNAMSEIKRVGKDSFWAKAEKDEENRRLEEKRRAGEEQQRLDRERRERELQEAAGRERRFKERASEIDAQKKYQQQQDVENRDKEKEQWKEQEKEHQAAQRRGLRRSEEAASLIAQRSMNPRDIFKQKERSMPSDAAAFGSHPGEAMPRALQRGGKEAGVRTSLPHILPLLSWGGRRRQGQPLGQASGTLTSTGRWSAKRALAICALLRQARLAGLVRVSLPSFPGKLRSPFLQKESSPVHAPASPVHSSAQDFHPPSLVHPPAQETPPASPAPSSGDAAVQDAGYRVARPVSPPQVEEESLYEEPPEESAVYEEPPTLEQLEDAKYEYAVEYQQQPDLEGKGLCARALYDYQAADDTEISFDPENIITNIEMIDEGWWRGYGPDGHFGMFPANYVELIE
nr:drebrin-like protein [Pelodiscus sinensis]|eukprot:XP_025043557.1 drebrin-like protein [Pelodiscus sinensis]